MRHGLTFLAGRRNGGPEIAVVLQVVVANQNQDKGVKIGYNGNKENGTKKTPIYH